MSTLATFMGTRSPNPAYKALVADTTDAYILAINLSEEAATEPPDYLVANEGITEHPGTLNPQISDTQYLHSGIRSSKIGNQRQFGIAGDRFSGDPFQEAILSYKMKYGTGNNIIRDYVHFNALTGVGEKGKIAIVIDEDVAGGAGDNSSFSGTLYAQGVPEEYTYTAVLPEG